MPQKTSKLIILLAAAAHIIIFSLKGVHDCNSEVRYTIDLPAPHLLLLIHTLDPASAPAAGSFMFWPHVLIHTLDPAPGLWDGDRSSPALPVHMDFRNHFEEAFLPERWLDDKTRPSQYMTFGMGQHLCLGQQVGGQKRG